jgi:hypothetical protein
LAIFNLILAISCAFCRLSQQDIQPNGDENLFFARARALSVSENILYDHDDLQQVQAEALMAFFLLVVSQINRYVIIRLGLERRLSNWCSPYVSVNLLIFF